MTGRSAHPIKVALLNLDRERRLPLIVDVGFVPVLDLGRGAALLKSRCLEVLLAPLKALSRNGRLFTINGATVAVFPNVLPHMSDHPRFRLRQAAAGFRVTPPAALCCGACLAADHARLLPRPLPANPTHLNQQLAVGYLHG